MAFRLRPVSSPGPRTYVGQWLRAGIFEDRDTQMRLGARMNGGQKIGWNDDEPAVAEAACELAARRFFGLHYDVRQVTAFVAELRERVKNSRTPISQLEAEAVIRSALGERDVTIGDLRRSTLFNVRCLATGQLCLRLGLNRQEVEQLISAAENMVFDRGWNPPIAEE